MVVSVLILSSPKDEHAQAVSGHLVEMGVRAAFWSFRQLGGGCRLRFNLDGSGLACRVQFAEKGLPDAGTGDLDLSGARSVWFRRPGAVATARLAEPWVESLAQWESSRALQAILRMLPCLWVNSPAAHAEALFKIRQLEVARQCGLSVPETLVTNDPQAVRDFYEQCAGQLIYKLIDEGSQHRLPVFERSAGIPTLSLRQADLEYLDQVRYSLHLFQRKIEKAADLRVTVVGKQLFAVEIRSQEGQGSTDFRLDYTVPMLEHRLPERVESSCFELARRLGLNFGAIDLCRDGAGEYFFFEINPAGQWLWMERALDLPISLSLARLLAGLEEPLVAGPWRP